MNDTRVASALRLMRLPEVLSIVGLGKTSWYKGIKEGLYPAPIHLTTRSVAWRSTDIEELVARLSQ